MGNLGRGLPYRYRFERVQFANIKALPFGILARNLLAQEWTKPRSREVHDSEIGKVWDVSRNGERGRRHIRTLEYLLSGLERVGERQVQHGTA